MKNNKGFSLVELIIVIAIMAILVGVMAPQLIKYIEKSNVASDEETLNAIYAAVVYSMNDPTVNQDSNSTLVIDSLINPVKLEDLDLNDTLFYHEILDTLGWSDLEQSTYEPFLHSAHASNATIMLQYKGSFMNPIAMWITTTDRSGSKITTYVPTDYTDTVNGIDNVIAIY